MASFYATSSQVGVDLQNASSTQLFALGSRVKGTGNSVWVYAQASTSVTAYKAVAISTAGAVGMASGNDLLGGLTMGIAQTAVPATYCAWFPIQGGPFTVMTSSSCSVANVHYMGTGTGEISITDSASTVLGLHMVSIPNQTASRTVAVCVLSFPQVKTLGGL